MAAPSHFLRVVTLSFVVRAASICVIVIGATVLLAWVFDVPGLQAIHPKLAPMRPSTALCLLLIGLGLVFLCHQDIGPGWRIFGRASASLAMLIGLFRLIWMRFGVDIQPESQFAKDLMNVAGGGMPIPTALNFLM